MQNIIKKRIIANNKLADIVRFLLQSNDVDTIKQHLIEGSQQKEWLQDNHVNLREAFIANSREWEQAIKEAVATPNIGFVSAMS